MSTGWNGGRVRARRTKFRSHLGNVTTERGRSALKERRSCLTWKESTKERPDAAHTELIADLYPSMDEGESCSDSNRKRKKSQAAAIEACCGSISR